MGLGGHPERTTAVPVATVVNDHTHMALETTHIHPATFVEA